ncbi:MAG: 30S ribosomal protein S6 [Candidatus Omnitrophica bacterium]|nr:30S ribosomal protein S6 [Candidatus Omnitrophota bacterium]MDD5080421.1 30S ribosomal protein S6 [Candidatus Omnitrophota bacterium]MDD5441101.1 30S ribosomal protein S6 [Candidatus Omnitrophota bacterium]
MARKYETMVIIRPDITDQEREEVFSKITKKIESLDGKVESAKIWAQERKFCFAMRGRGAAKKEYMSGCYWLVIFTLPTDKQDELKETIRLEERIIRNVVIRRDK